MTRFKTCKAFITKIITHDLALGLGECPVISESSILSFIIHFLLGARPLFNAIRARDGCRNHSLQIV